MDHYNRASPGFRSPRNKSPPYLALMYLCCIKQPQRLLTCEHLGPTACVSATVNVTFRHFTPSSPTTQSSCTMFVVLRMLWKSTRNFDLENNNENSVSTLIGKIVCTNCRPSCIELHSAVLTNGMLDVDSESLESDMSVGSCSLLAADAIWAPVSTPRSIRDLRAVGFVGSLRWGSFMVTVEAAVNWSILGETDKDLLFDDDGRLLFDLASCSAFLVVAIDFFLNSKCGSDWSC